MANITRLARLVNGILRNVDMAANTLVVTSIRVGGATTNTELTKAILDNLVTLQAGGDVGSTLHTHDSIYYTQSQLGSSTASSGSDLIGDDNTYSNFTPSAATVKGALSAIDTALGGVNSDENVKVSANDTTAGFLNDKIVVDVGTNTANSLEASIVNAGANEDLRIRLDESKITIASSQISDKGAANGVASLDSAGKVPASQLPNAIMSYKGTWDASTNTPTLADGVGNADSDIGNVYRVSVAGTQDLGSGPITFNVGDYVILNASKVWEKADTTDAVASVNGKTGTVVLVTDDINEGTTNLYFTNARAQAAAVDDTVYGVSWNGVTNIAPSKNAVYDKIEALDAAKQNASPNLDEADTFFGATDITAAEAETLTNGSNADSLHKHAVLYQSLTNNTGATITAGSVVALSTTAAGEIILADASALATCEATIGVVLADIPNASAGLVQIAGEATVANGGVNLSLGKRVYLSETAGQATSTAPTTLNSVIYLLGHATAVNKILLAPKMIAVNE